MASESPKWLALALSVIAITVSGLSWWESHRNRVINEEVNRPLLSLSGIITEPQIAYSDETEPIPAVFAITLKNNGKTSARLHKMEVDPRLSRSFGECRIVPDENAHNLDKGDIGQFGDVLPGLESVARILFHARKCRTTPAVSPNVRIRVTYTDVSSGRVYIQTLDGYVALNLFLDVSNTGSPATAPSKPTP